MPTATIIPFELPLPQILPTIEGNVDYRDFRDQLLRIDGLLVQSDLETQMLEADLQRWLARAKARQRQGPTKPPVPCPARLALQYRPAPPQRGLPRLCRPPGRQPPPAVLLRHQRSGPRGRAQQEHPPTLLHLVARGRGAAIDPRAPAPGRSQAPEQLGLAQPLDLESAYLDSTCLCANIHYPVDWVLLRDATRTLMGSVRLIRDQGLKHRMEEPESFIRRINGLCIKMTHAWNRQDQAESQRLRKQTLRQMDRLVGTVRNHARRYRELLDAHWEQTDWTRPQAEQVLGRMDQVLEQLPKARQQARQRILEGQLVPNEEKILSLYEADVQVIVRKKAGAEVEFGNTLFLAENPQGADYRLGVVPGECPGRRGLAAAQCGRMQEAYAPGPKALAGDRGFDSELNRFGLDEEGIFNAVCPRSPAATPAAEPFLEIQAHAAAPGANRRAHRHCQERFSGGADALQRFCAPGTDRDLDGVGA